MVSSLSPTFFHFHFHLAADKTFRKWMREDGVLPFSHVLLFPAPDFVSHTPPSRLTFWRYFESQQIGSKEASYCKMQRLCQSWPVWPIHWETSSSGQKQPVQTLPCDEDMQSLKLWGRGGGWVVCVVDDRNYFARQHIFRSFYCDLNCLFIHHNNSTTGSLEMKSFDLFFTDVVFIQYIESWRWKYEKDQWTGHVPENRGASEGILIKIMSLQETFSYCIYMKIILFDTVLKEKTLLIFVYFSQHLVL